MWKVTPGGWGGERSAAKKEAGSAEAKEVRAIVLRERNFGTIERTVPLPRELDLERRPRRSSRNGVLSLLPSQKTLRRPGGPYAASR